MRSGAGKRWEAYCFTAPTCLVRIREGWPTSMASDHRARAKGDEATYSPRSWETKGSRKLLAPLKRTSVMLSSVRVSKEKGITRAIQGNMVVWRGGGGCGQPEGGCPRPPPTQHWNLSTIPLCNNIPRNTP